jgi:hypothetical protein
MTATYIAQVCHQQKLLRPLDKGQRLFAPQ